jgi:hypothetical protein
MTKERLQSLPWKFLEQIARREGIQSINGMGRNALIEQIIEAIEEDRCEREAGNNSAIHVEEKKYEIIRDEELEIETENEYEIPESYNETRIVFMLRDPLWAFAYWDIRSDEIETLKEDPLFQKLFLRVFEVNEHQTYCAIVDSFDIPVKTSDNKWYINLPRAGRAYFITLMCKINRREKELCRSNIISSPNKTFMDMAVREKILDNMDSDMLVLSGLHDYVETSSYRENIPQRIISMVDTVTQTMNY